MSLRYDTPLKFDSKNFLMLVVSLAQGNLVLKDRKLKYIKLFSPAVTEAPFWTSDM